MKQLTQLSPKKTFILNNNFSNVDLISHDRYGVAKDNVLAFGLRQPWKFMEYKNYLFIPDIGRYTMEELNVKLNDSLIQKNLFLWLALL